MLCTAFARNCLFDLLALSGLVSGETDLPSESFMISRGCQMHTGNAQLCWLCGCRLAVVGRDHSGRTGTVVPTVLSGAEACPLVALGISGGSLQ